jgi:hypothetical protein
VGLFSGLTRAAHALVDHTGIAGVGGGSGVTVQEEGTPLATAGTTFNFTGAGVTASGTGATKTIDIPGGAGGPIDILEGVSGGEVYVDTDIFLTPTSGGVVWVDSGDGLIFPEQNTDPAVNLALEGQTRFDSSIGKLRFFHNAENALNGHWETLNGDGWMPNAFPLGFIQDGAYTTALNLAAAGGTAAIPIYLPSPMRLKAVTFWNTDASLARSAEVAIFSDPGKASSAPWIPLTNDFFSDWTAAAASLRTMSYGSGSSAPWLPAGLVWLCIRNTHATNTLGIGTMAQGAQIAPNLFQTKTIAAFLGDNPTLDMVTGWTKQATIPGAALRGMPFATSAAY